MPNYKSVRVEESVYEELLRNMKLRESMSQVIARLIINLRQVQEHARAIVKTLEEDTPWNTKR